ncbi:MAG TPA: hypothetical protein VJ438_06305 [Candidatus Nanoarchaeia archaeon]|nr:hypothetical protein [Candidatus Nanoarchaeia archaeon]
MGNMSYCRFENTLKTLEDCLEHWEDELSVEERTARENILELCEDIVGSSNYQNFLNNEDPGYEIDLCNAD